MPARYPYRIETPRLVIRCWEPRDATALKEAIDKSLEHLRPWMPWALKEPQTLEEKIDLLRSFRGKFDLGQDHIYGVFDRGETKVVGGSGLHSRVGPDAAEIGYWIAVDEIGQGYCTELVAALTKAGFEYAKLDRVEIRCEVANTRSARIPERLGFSLEATLRRRVEGSDGEKKDALVWTMHASEYPGTPSSELEVSLFDAAGAPISKG